MAAGLIITCPACQRELKINDRRVLGRKGKCPKCQHVFVMEEPPEIELEEVDQEAGGQSVAPATSAAFMPPAASPFEGIPTGPGMFPDLAHEASPLKTLKSRRRPKSLLNRLIGPVLAIVVVAGGVAVAFVSFGTGDAARPAAFAPDPSELNPSNIDVPAIAAAPSTVTIDSIEFQAPTKKEPLALKYVPSGTRVVIHLRPAELWKGDSLAEEVRYSLGPLAEFAATQIKALSGAEPAQVELATFCLIPTQRGMAPSVAAVFTFVEPIKKSDFLEKYGGQRDDTNGYPIYLTDKLGYLLSSDARTMAVSPLELASEMAQASTNPNPTSSGIEELLPMLDASRHFTVLFEPLAVRLDAEYLVSPNVRPLLDRLLDWLGDDVETAAWSVHLGDKGLFSQMWLRNSNVIQPNRLARLVEQKLETLPQIFLSAVQSMSPREMGKRQVIGRFPAMTRAFGMASRTKTSTHHVEVVTPLPERAAPNLALASLLAWDESTRTDFSRKPAAGTMAQTGNAVAGPKLPEALTKLIDVDFRRTPLQEAFAYVADELKITIDIDGDALKLSGYTKNMPQEFQLNQISANKALFEIIKKYDKMCLVIDQKQNRVLVTTYPVAEAQKLTTYVFPKE
jgi:predicted Zn finger-like uncharacterized protein